MSFLYIYKKNQNCIAHNIPAVWMLLTQQYQGFGVPNKGFAKHRFRRKRDQGRKNVPEVWKPLAWQLESGNERSD
jgi:hypothetical protein